MAEPSVRPGRGRLQVLGIAALFFVPAIGAWLLLLSGWHPQSTTNTGVLIDPPQPVAAAEWRWRGDGPVPGDWFTGHWTVLAVRDGPCDATCREALDSVLRVRIVLGRDAHRVETILLQPPDVTAPTDAPPALRLATAPPAVIDRLMTEALPPGVTPAATAFYLIDYLGFRMMAYPQPLDASGLLDDLEQLLELANEDVERMQLIRKQQD